MKNWHALATCLGRAKEMFPDTTNRPGIKHAKSICAACPVRELCLRAAMAAEAGRGKNNRYGIFGGLTPGQRHTLAGTPDTRTAATPGPDCGTMRGHRRHIRDGEQLDPACREARRIDQRERRQRERKTAVRVAPQLAPCGTESAYTRHIRRKEPVDDACRAARKEAILRRRNEKAAKCGTNSGYAQHLREKTPICDGCRQAHNDADRRLRNTGTTKAAA